MVVQLWSYGCTTIRVLVVQLQNSDFLTESTNLDNNTDLLHFMHFYYIPDILQERFSGRKFANFEEI